MPPSRRDLAVDATPQTERIGILQAVRQERLRHVLVADGPEEAVDRERADRGRTAVGGRREGTAMHYGVADLDARAEAVHQDAADLGLEQRQEGAGHLVIRWLHVERCGKLPFQPLQDGPDIVKVAAADDEPPKTSSARAWPERNAPALVPNSPAWP